MKKITLKILAMLMAFIVVFTTLSFTVDMHYCGDTLVDTAIFNKVKSCGMELQKSSSELCVIKKNNCCSDKQLIIDGQEELQISFSSLSLEEPLSIKLIPNTIIAIDELLNENVPFYLVYFSRLVIRQLYKLDETYLI